MTSPIRVLALSPIPEEGAGCRFRIAQFIPYLKADGVDVTLSPLFTTEFFRLVYRPGHFMRKTAGFARLAVERLWSLHEAKDFDVVFIYREVFPVGPAIVERVLAAGGPPIVFDFDDAIFLPSVSEANRLIAALKSPAKVATIIAKSAQVIAGNSYLAAYAARYNSNVTMIPTCVDTTRFRPMDSRTSPNGAPRIGWIGSPTTAGYIEALAPVLTTLASSHGFVLTVSGAGRPISMPGVKIDNQTWSLDREIDLFRNLDIGVYPLADDEWSLGKCGFKAIEFMACGVPVVAAAVGVNREIIEDGVNGFLASTGQEWVQKLRRLIDDPALRARFAEAGRRTIEERYSLAVNAPKLAAVLKSAARTNRGGSPR